MSTPAATLGRVRLIDHEGARDEQYGGELGDREQGQTVFFSDRRDDGVQLIADTATHDHHEERAVVGQVSHDQKSDGDRRHFDPPASRVTPRIAYTGPGSPLLDMVLFGDRDWTTLLRFPSMVCLLGSTSLSVAR